jgi:spermidine synthase
MKNYNKINDSWFSEICSLWPGMSLSLEIKKVLYSKKSQFQQIDLYQTKNHGKMLVLDGIIQLTESDEFAYHEMLAHIPLFAHPHPENVLVIGGGDGGVLREVGRHDCVKDIDLCEIVEGSQFISPMVILLLRKKQINMM